MELKVWANFLSLFLKALEGSPHHKHVETNEWVAEHNSYPLENQSFVETPVYQTGQICCQQQLKNLTFEWSRHVYIYLLALNGFWQSKICLDQ